MEDILDLLDSIDTNKLETTSEHYNTLEDIESKIKLSKYTFQHTLDSLGRKFSQFEFPDLYIIFQSHLSKFGLVLIDLYYNISHDWEYYNLPYQRSREELVLKVSVESIPSNVIEILNLNHFGELQRYICEDIESVIRKYVSLEIDQTIYY